MEFGCGDGNNLDQYKIENYLGLDVAKSAIDICERRYAHDPSKSFELITPNQANTLDRSFDLVICLEVLMHVIDEDDYVWTLDQIFASSSSLVAIFNPLTPIRRFSKGSHENYRNLLGYLVPYIGEYALIDVVTHPSTTPIERLNGHVGDMASDFVILQRR